MCGPLEPCCRYVAIVALIKRVVSIHDHGLGVISDVRCRHGTVTEILAYAGTLSLEICKRSISIGLVSGRIISPA